MPYFLIVLDYHISTNYEKLTKALNTFCVNALTRAYPISTDEGNPNPDDVIEVCQCPYSGLSHFYVEPEEPPVEPEELYQCPYLGLSHFYESEQPEETEQLEVCQCPYSGLSHFYTQRNKRRGWRNLVSMPLLGLIPFLRKKVQKRQLNQSCVNALTRAYPIST